MRSRCAPPRQQGFVILNRECHWQAFKCAQPCIVLLAVSFGSLDQAVLLSIGRSAFGRVAEQPVRPSDHEGADRPRCGVVVDWRVTLLNVPFEFAPVAGQLADVLAQGVWWAFSPRFRSLRGRAAHTKPKNADEKKDLEFQGLF